MLNRRAFIKRALSTGVGLGTAAMFNGCSGLTRQDFPEFRETDRPIASLDNTESAILYHAELAEQGGGWLVITSPGQTVAELIDTGRRFERMALLAREKGIGIHPMTQILEEKNGLEQIAGSHGSSFFPQFVLRVGYLEKYPAPVSLRRPVDWFVTT